MNPLREFWLKCKARRVGGATMRDTGLSDGWYGELRFFFGALDRMARGGQEIHVYWLCEWLGSLHAEWVGDGHDDPQSPVYNAIRDARRRCIGVCRACGSMDVEAIPDGITAVQWCAKHRTSAARREALLAIAQQDLAEAERLIKRGADHGLVQAVAAHETWMQAFNGIGSRYG